MTQKQTVKQSTKKTVPVQKNQKKQKSAMTYGFLALFLGWVGVHKFYAGKTGQGFLSMALFILLVVLSVVLMVLCAAWLVENDADEDAAAGVMMILTYFVIVPMWCGLYAWWISDAIKGFCNVRTPERIFGKK